MACLAHLFPAIHQRNHLLVPDVPKSTKKGHFLFGSNKVSNADQYRETRAIYTAGLENSSLSNYCAVPFAADEPPP
jgi:hypothetical protein